MDSNSPSWISNLLGGLGQAASVGAAWKELVNPVKAVQTPVLSMGSGSPSIIPSAAAGQATLNQQKPPLGISTSTALWIAGGLGVLLLTLILSRKK